MTSTVEVQRQKSRRVKGRESVSNVKGSLPVLAVYTIRESLSLNYLPLAAKLWERPKLSHSALLTLPSLSTRAQPWHAPSGFPLGSFLKKSDTVVYVISAVLLMHARRSVRI